MKAGCPEKVSTLLAKTLKELEYHPTTAKGAAKPYSKYTEKSPGYGTGQGAKVSPRKWTLVDNNIIKQHKKWAIGLIMYDPTGRVKTKRCLVKFVNDATLLHNLPNVFNLKPKDLMEIVK
eukprot:10482241-Ditylum_brightwellii.AAC.1